MYLSLYGYVEAKNPRVCYAERSEAPSQQALLRSTQSARMSVDSVTQWVIIQTL